MQKPLLGDGYIKLVESWGSDEAIIEGARMSTQKGFLGWGEPAGFIVKLQHDGRGWWMRRNPGGPPGLPAFTSTQNAEEAVLFEMDKDAADALREYRRRYGDVDAVIQERPAKQGDEKLLAYLWKNAHSTPFEMAGLTIEAQAPIVVFREWHRHRVPFGYSELSARYTPLPDVNYIPTMERLMMGAKSAGANKQAGALKGAAQLTEEAASRWVEQLKQVYAMAEDVYQNGLAAGIPKELARLPVPVGRFSRHRATGNLRGWLAFMKLRCAPTAQWEIRQYADAVAEYVAAKFPRTWAVIQEHGL